MFLWEVQPDVAVDYCNNNGHIYGFATSTNCCCSDHHNADNYDNPCYHRLNYDFAARTNRYCRATGTFEGTCTWPPHIIMLLQHCRIIDVIVTVRYWCYCDSPVLMLLQQSSIDVIRHTMQLRFWNNHFSLILLIGHNTLKWYCSVLWPGTWCV